MKIGSLFSGYGGLDLAVEQFYGGHTVWHCEHDEAPATILGRHWPGVPNHRDVTQINWATVEPVDILTGGYPCQPFSSAGHRKGTNDERHLWPYVRQAICQLRPRITVLENVSGHRSMGFGAVLGDLAADGYDVRWHSLRASDIGAPHHRERVFIVVTDPAGLGSQAGHLRTVGPGPVIPGTNGGGPPLPDPDGIRRHGWGPAPGQTGPGSHQTVGGHSIGIEWGQYGPAVRRWELLMGPAPAPTEVGRRGQARLNPAFAEWMMGLPAGWVTDVPGLTRAHQLKAIGNGVCPPQALAALAHINAIQLPERIDR